MLQPLLATLMFLARLPYRILTNRNEASGFRCYTCISSTSRKVFLVIPLVQAPVLSVALDPSCAPSSAGNAGFCQQNPRSTLHGKANHHSTDTYKPNPS